MSTMAWYDTTTDDLKSSKIEPVVNPASVHGCDIFMITITSALCTALSVYSISLYGSLSNLNLTDTLDSNGKCNAGTSLYLVFALSILNLLAGSCAIITLLAQTAVLIIDRRTVSEQNKIRTLTYSVVMFLTTCIRYIVTMTDFAILVVLSIFLWRDQCQSVYPSYFNAMQIFLIIYWAVGYGTGCGLGLMFFIRQVYVNIRARKDVQDY
jgi:hypothetical protein